MVGKGILVMRIASPRRGFGGSRGRVWSGGGAAQREHGGAVLRGTAISRATARTRGWKQQGEAPRKKMKNRKRQVERLYMLSRKLVKTVSCRGSGAMHDFHSAQV